MPLTTDPKLMSLSQSVIEGFENSRNVEMILCNSVQVVICDGSVICEFSECGL